MYQMGGLGSWRISCLLTQSVIEMKSVSDLCSCLGRNEMTIQYDTPPYSDRRGYTKWELCAGICLRQLEESASDLPITPESRQYMV